MSDKEWHVTQLTPEAAMAHEKRIRNLGPEIGLGWIPYNYLVTRGAVSQWGIKALPNYKPVCRGHFMGNHRPKTEMLAADFL